MRAAAKSYSLHPLEKALVSVVIALLVFLPWAFGGMRVWTQYTALGLSSLAFIIALIPRRYDERYHAGGNLRLIMWPKLVKFPLFWLGLAYFALILCQIFNPAWTYRSSDAGWWMESIPYIEWLPHGVEGTPFRMMNGWRTLMIHGGAWLMLCALWVGITRRKTAKFIITTMAINGLLVALIVILQRLVPTRKLLWSWEPGSYYFAAGFVYKNHAGEFLCLILALCLGLAWWHMAQAERQMKKSHPGVVWALGATMVLAGQMFTYARAATAISAAFFAIVAAAFLVRQLFRTRGGTPPLATAATAMLGAGFMAVVITQMDTNKVWKKFERLFEEDQAASIQSRRLARQATLDLALDATVVGHGAGSFRFLFPLYQQNYPDIYRKRIETKTTSYLRRLYWEHAHNDYAEFLAEFGLIGIALVLLLFLALLLSAWQANLLGQFGLFAMFGGPALVAATATVDFPFYNPAVLFTTLAVPALILRWAQLMRRT